MPTRGSIRLLAEVRQEARGTHAKGIEIYILTIKNDYFLIFARGLLYLGDIFLFSFPFFL
jgi:hypothetical protein